MAADDKPGHVAFKCNWHDGRPPGSSFPGWEGRCTWNNLLINVRGQGPTKARQWCSHPDSQCRKLADGQTPKRAGDGGAPCFESVLFSDATFSPGPQKNVRGAKERRLAVFTSRRPGTSEAERLIIGAMVIKGINEEGRFDNCKAVTGYVDTLVRLTEDQYIPYWHVVRPTPIGPAWGAGLVRYLDDPEARSIVAALEHVGADVAALRKRAILDSGEVDVTSPPPPAISDEGLQGQLDVYRDKFLAHERQVFLRNPALAAAVRAQAEGVCAACLEEVDERYGVEILEAHHLRAFSVMPADSKLKLSDLAALCPSCHRALHRHSPSTASPLNIVEFRKMLGALS